MRVLPSTAQLSSPALPLYWPKVHVSPFDQLVCLTSDLGPVHASIESLRQQGGPFNNDEALEFALEPYADEAIALRRHDDDGKGDGRDVAPLADYRDLLTRFVPAGVADGEPAPARSTGTGAAARTSVAARGR